MLLLSRRAGEAIVLHTRDTVTTVRVLETGRGQIVLGIDAPPSVVILREELIQEEEETR